MEIEQSKKLTMIIQGNNACFATMTSYEECEEGSETKFNANVRVEAGHLIAGREYTIILSPFDVLTQNIGMSAS